MDNHPCYHHHQSITFVVDYHIYYNFDIFFTGLHIMVRGRQICIFSHWLSSYAKGTSRKFSSTNIISLIQVVQTLNTRLMQKCGSIISNVSKQWSIDKLSGLCLNNSGTGQFDLSRWKGLLMWGLEYCTVGCLGYKEAILKVNIR